MQVAIEDFHLECEGWAGYKKEDWLRHMYQNALTDHSSRNKKSIEVQKVDQKYNWKKKLEEWCYLPPVGASSGIVIIWDSHKFNKLDHIIGSYSLSISFSDLESGIACLLSWVYNTNIALNRQNLWEELLHV